MATATDFDMVESSSVTMPYRLGAAMIPGESAGRQDGTFRVTGAKESYIGVAAAKHALILESWESRQTKNPEHTNPAQKPPPPVPEGREGEMDPKELATLLEKLKRTDLMTEAVQKEWSEAQVMARIAEDLEKERAAVSEMRESLTLEKKPAPTPSPQEGAPQQAPQAPQEQQPRSLSYDELSEMRRLAREEGQMEAFDSAVEARLTPEEFRAKLAEIRFAPRPVVMRREELRATIDSDRRFSFELLTKGITNESRPERLYESRYEMNVVHEHEDGGIDRVANSRTACVPDWVINREMMRQAPALAGRHLRVREAIASTGAANVTQTMVEYARTQGPLYDRLPLRQYCQMVPVVRGKAQIPQITGGLTVNKSAENAAPTLSDPTISKVDIDLLAYAAGFQISGLADLYSGPGFLTSFLMSDVIPLIEEEINADIITAALAVAGISVVATGAMTWAKLVAMEGTLTGAKAINTGNRVYIMDDALYTTAKATQKFANYGDAIIEGDVGGMGGMLNGYPAYPSTKITANNILLTDWFWNMFFAEGPGWMYVLDDITVPTSLKVTMWRYAKAHANTGYPTTIVQFVNS